MKNYIPLKKTMTIFFFPKHITYFFNQPKVKTYLLTTVNLHIISLQCVFSYHFPQIPQTTPESVGETDIHR